ncbi:hypothetical protein [Streptomyces griseoruber]|uniref:hypothetical protein n=1 Tax=Streptomyces griseoruber TaxID=1943 RepID=UPI0037B78A89
MSGSIGPRPDLEQLARDADLFPSEAAYLHRVPAADAPYLPTAGLAGEYARRAGARRLLLTSGRAPTPTGPGTPPPRRSVPRRGRHRDLVTEVRAEQKDSP